MDREELAASAQGGLWKVLGILLRVEDVLEDLARDFPDSPEDMLRDKQPEDVMLAVEVAIRCAISDDLWPLMERLKRAAGICCPNKVAESVPRLVRCSLMERSSLRIGWLVPIGGGSAEEVGHQEPHVREGFRRDPLPPPILADFLVAVGRGLPIGEERVGIEVRQPRFEDAGLRVEGYLDVAVVGKGGFRHLDQEKDIPRVGSARPEIGPAPQEDDIGLRDGLLAGKS